MTPAQPDPREVYYKDATSWANDRNEALRSSRRMAWRIATVAVIVVVIEAIALAALVPLKTVVPYTLLVDRQTGYVQALDPLEPNRIAPDTALIQSFLVQYVIARESFDIATVQADYRKVALWSADSAGSDYVATMQVSNPNSPLARLPRSAIVETRIRSISALGNRSALVRFETSRRDRGGAPQLSQGWVAIVHYRFSDKPMSIEDRFLNPLGFQVLRYRRNAETPPLAAGPTGQTLRQSDTGAVSPNGTTGAQMEQVPPSPSSNARAR